MLNVKFEESFDKEYTGVESTAIKCKNCGAPVNTGIPTFYSYASGICEYCKTKLIVGMSDDKKEIDRSDIEVLPPKVLSIKSNVVKGYTEDFFQEQYYVYITINETNKFRFIMKDELSMKCHSQNMVHEKAYLFFNNLVYLLKRENFKDEYANHIAKEVMRQHIEKVIKG